MNRFSADEMPAGREISQNEEALGLMADLLQEIDKSMQALTDGVTHLVKDAVLPSVVAAHIDNVNRTLETVRGEFGSRLADFEQEQGEAEDPDPGPEELPSF
jgi:hypothetical protein